MSPGGHWPYREAEGTGWATCTHSVGRAGGKAKVSSLAFRFLCLRSPPGEMLPSVLLLAPVLLCSAPLACVGGAGTFLSLSDPEGTEGTMAWAAAVSVPISRLCAASGTAFLFRATILGCFLDSV